MKTEISSFVANPEFPCVMAKAVMSKGYVDDHILHGSDVQKISAELLEKIYEFIDHFRSDPETLSTFIVSFADEKFKSFSEFETFFWELLETIDQHDKQNYSADPRVSSDPNDAHFSFSLKGEAFFMLILHPESPRLARRFSMPTIVFNAHQQFEDLREKGVFEKVRDLIRKRDISLQGFMNPMVKDYGTDSEVFQYTGKVYPEQSKCPFAHLEKASGEESEANEHH